jgi:hypothetical protein
MVQDALLLYHYGRALGLLLACIDAAGVQVAAALMYASSCCACASNLHSAAGVHMWQEQVDVQLVCMAGSGIVFCQHMTGMYELSGMCIVSARTQNVWRQVCEICSN